MRLKKAVVLSGALMCATGYSMELMPSTGHIFSINDLPVEIVQEIWKFLVCDKDNYATLLNARQINKLWCHAITQAPIYVTYRGALNIVNNDFVSTFTCSELLPTEEQAEHFYTTQLVTGRAKAVAFKKLYSHWRVPNEQKSATIELLGKYGLLPLRYFPAVYAKYVLLMFANFSARTSNSHSGIGKMCDDQGRVCSAFFAEKNVPYKKRCILFLIKAGIFIAPTLAYLAWILYGDEIKLGLGNLFSTLKLLISATFTKKFLH